MIGILWFDVFRIRRAVAIDNIKQAYPELGTREAVQMARGSLLNMGRSIVEFGLFPFLTARELPKLVEIKGLENFERAIAKGKGVLFLGVHLGNGDLGIAALSRMGYPISLISKNFKLKWLNDLWFGMRERHGTRFISPENSSFQILRALKSRRNIFFVLDQFMGPPIGCRTTFFNRETGTAMGLAIIAHRSGAPVVPAYTYRRSDGRHQIVLLPEVAWQDASLEGQKADSDDVEIITSMTQIYTDTIEAIVRQHPEQWMWIHRRWKKF